jgi:hypothetical protein
MLSWETLEQLLPKEETDKPGWWLTPVMLATQEAEMRGSWFEASPGQTDRETLSQKTLHKKRLAEWLKW